MDVPRLIKVAAVTVVVCAAILGVAYGYIQYRQATVLTTNLPIEFKQAVTASPLVIEHTVVDNVHVFKGVVTLPDSCTSLSDNIVVSGASDVQVVIALEAIVRTGCNTLEPRTQDFSLAVGGSGTQSVTLSQVTFNGTNFPFTLTEGATL